jgi:hypothetical protein
MVPVNPRADDFFVRVIEQKSIYKRSNKSLANFLKVLGNSGSYGLFVQVDSETRNRFSIVLRFASLFSHPTLHDIVITKFPLGSDYKTDFAFITRHSMTLQFTFVELEAPSKRIFNKNGALSQPFRQAQQQLSDWLRWSEQRKDVLVAMFATSAQMR